MSCKQIKVIADQIDAKTGSFSVGFSDQINIKANSSIALDKFIYSGFLNSQNSISLESQDILIFPDESRTNKATIRQATIPSGTYSSISQVNDMVQNKLNMALVSGGSTEIFEYANANEDPVNGPVFDVGLGFNVLDDAETNKTIIQFVQADKKFPAQPSQTNMTFLTNEDGKNIGMDCTTPDVGFFFHSAKPILRGGFVMDLVIRTGASVADYSAGLCLLGDLSVAPVVKYGVKWENTGIWSIIDNGEVVGVLDFPNVGDGDHIIWYIEDGRLKVSITDPDYDILKTFPSGNVVQFANIYRTFDMLLTSGTYEFGLVGQTPVAIPADTEPAFEISLHEQPNVTPTPSGGWAVVPVDRLHHVLGGSITMRQLKLDFTMSQILVSGLGYNIPILDFGYAIEDSILAENVPNFAGIPDLALEIMNIPLENYEAKTNLRQSTRRNVIAYFTPTMTDSNRPDARYFQNTNGLQFLQISNQAPISISTLNFRIYDALNNTSVTPEYLSFTLLIKEPI